ncbi:MAG: DUF4261 domain-containing protein [Clostridiaceae bacterium]
MFDWKKKNEEKEEDIVEEEIIEDGFRPTYNVELLYEKMPNFSADILLKKLRESCRNVEILTETKDKGLLAFIFEDYLVEYKDNKKVPAQCIIAKTDKVIELKSFESSIQQSWEWREAGEAIENCKYSILVSDMMAAGLEYQSRLELFQKFLVTILEEFPCNAIHWVPSGQIVNPITYLESQRDSSNLGHLYGAVNVRFFNISNGVENEMLMDTVGLAALGIPDLQCHFIDLDPGKIGSILYNYAYYLFENGDVIEDGHTIEGTECGEKWKCQHEFSLVEPQRIVVDMNPGSEHVAGNRSEIE